MILLFALEYANSGPTGDWSSTAKHLTPTLIAREIDGNPGDFEPVVNGVKRRRYTAFDPATTPPTLIRRDYALADLRRLGAQLPETYIDERGDIRDGEDNLVMPGPQ